MKYHDWITAQHSERFPTAEELQDGDIVMKLPDGKLYLIGSGGGLRRPSPFDRLIAWLFR